MEREEHVATQGYENVELKMAYCRRLPFLLIVEEVFTFINGELDVFGMVRRYDYRRACIATYNSNRH
jgi:hypothetical protein